MKAKQQIFDIFKEFFQPQHLDFNIAKDDFFAPKCN